MTDKPLAALHVAVLKALFDRWAILDRDLRDDLMTSTVPGERLPAMLPGSDSPVAWVTRTKPTKAKPAPVAETPVEGEVETEPVAADAKPARGSKPKARGTAKATLRPALERVPAAEPVAEPVADEEPVEDEPEDEIEMSVASSGILMPGMRV